MSESLPNNLIRDPLRRQPEIRNSTLQIPFDKHERRPNNLQPIPLDELLRIEPHPVNYVLARFA